MFLVAEGTRPVVVVKTVLLAPTAAEPPLAEAVVSKFASHVILLLPFALVYRLEILAFCRAHDPKSCVKTAADWGLSAKLTFATPASC